MAAITICIDFGAPKIKSDTVSTISLFIYHEVMMGLDAMILIFWMLSFKPTFSLSSFTSTSLQNHNLKRYMNPNVHCSTICNSQDRKPVKKSIDRWIDKEDMVYMHNGLLLRHKEKQNWVIFSDLDNFIFCLCNCCD